MFLNQIVIYTDGACSGNPGPGGFAGIIALENTAHEVGGFEPQTTNNRMELLATITSLQYVASKLSVQHQQTKINLFTDSVYVIKGITQWIFGWKKKGWKNAASEPVTNQDLWHELDQVVLTLQQKFNLKIDWQYVRGHKGISGNERCDEIAVAFSKNESVYLYSGNLKNYSFDLLKTPASEPLPENSFKKTDHKTSAWYLVFKNGVLTKYKTWSECEAVVKGVPNVKFKKVTSEAEEATVLKSWGV